MDRVTRLLASANSSEMILEIGPGYSPVAPKAAGWRTHVVDHTSRDALRAKYAAASVDISLIEQVDTIWQDGQLHEAVPPGLLGRVDLMIASHVLEHLPDLIGFLNSASRIIRPGGRLSVAFPDRRYCFDCLKPWTTTGDLLDAHLRQSKRHSIKTAFNHMAYSAVVDGQLAWGPKPISAPVLLDRFAAAADTVALFREEGEYKDYHAWHFSPAGFELVFLELVALGLSDWWIETLEGPENFEFFILLRQGAGQHLSADELQTRRTHLLTRQLIEVGEQVDFMLARQGG